MTFFSRPLPAVPFWFSPRYQKQGAEEKINVTLDIFKTPVPVTPKQEISKTLSSSKNSLKALNAYFGEITFTLGGTTFTFGEITFNFGDNRDFRIFFAFFVAGGFGTPWVGGSRRGFRKYLNVTLLDESVLFMLPGF